MINELKKTSKVNNCASSISNTFNIRNNNTIHYLENPGQITTNINKVNKISKEKNTSSSVEYNSQLLSIAQVLTPKSDRKETIELKKENIKNLLGVSSNDNCKSKHNSKEKPTERATTGFNSQSKQIMETLNTINPSATASKVVMAKDSKSNSLNFNNFSQYTKFDLTKLKSKNNNNLVNSSVGNKGNSLNHKNTNTSKCIDSSKMPINIKNVSTLVKKHQKQNSVPSNNLIKHENIVLKSYLSKMSEREAINLGIQSKNLRTLY